MDGRAGAGNETGLRALYMYNKKSVTAMHTLRIVVVSCHHFGKALAELMLAVKWSGLMLTIQSVEWTGGSGFIVADNCFSSICVHIVINVLQKIRIQTVRIQFRQLRLSEI